MYASNYRERGRLVSWHRNADVTRHQGFALTGKVNEYPVLLKFPMGHYPEHHKLFLDIGRAYSRRQGIQGRPDKEALPEDPALSPALTCLLI